MRGEARAALARVSRNTVDVAMVCPLVLSFSTISRNIATLNFRRRSRMLLPTRMPREPAGTPVPSTMLMRVKTFSNCGTSVPTRRKKALLPCSPSGPSLLSSQSRVATGSVSISAHSSSDKARCRTAVASTDADVSVMAPCFCCCSRRTPTMTLTRAPRSWVVCLSPSLTDLRSASRARSRSPGDFTPAVAMPMGITARTLSTPSMAPRTLEKEGMLPSSSVPRLKPPNSESLSLAVLS